MPMGHRRVAFSGKKKKQQMQAKKERKKEKFEGDTVSHPFNAPVARATAISEAILEKLTESGTKDEENNTDFLEETLALNHQPGGRANRYNLKFRKETPKEAEKRKARHHECLNPITPEQLEYGTKYFYPSGLDYPKRPAWNKGMSRRDLDQSEHKHFRLFCQRLNKEFRTRDLSLYELNLETWRQLWRVTEMADILLIIVDARFPVAQFPPYLYQHLQQENKGVILLLNKCDLVPPAVVVAWLDFFQHNYPKLVVVPFSSMEGYGRGKVKMAAEGSIRLADACEMLMEGAANLTLWRKKIEEEREVESEVDECEVAEGVTVVKESTTPEVHERLKDGILTIGTIGHPNVGKSSLINALMGKKVVSVSRTPGHTKHFQTIFLTKNVKLCDCPGLVFPSRVSMELQVMFGSFPIAQVRDPINVVRYIASRLDMPTILKLKHPETSDNIEVQNDWTAYYISESWARKRGYFVKRRGSPDVSRAANELLRFCLNGYKSLILYLRPPDYHKQREMFEADPRAEEARLIQGVHARSSQKVIEEMEEDEEYIQEKEEEGGYTCSESESDEENFESCDDENDVEEKEDSGDSGDDDDEEEEEVPSTLMKNKFSLLEGFE